MMPSRASSIPSGHLPRPRLAALLPLGGALLSLLCAAGCGHDDGTAAFEDLKRQLQSQDDAVRRLKAVHLAVEGRRGFLIAGDAVTLEQRDVVQRQNVSRERAFAVIAVRTHRKPEEVAALFSDQARQHDGQTTSNPP